jgi:hypothetical protein
MTTTKPIKASVTRVLPWADFLESDEPAPIINIRPPKIKRARRITPAIVREFLSMTETRDEKEGKFCDKFLPVPVGGSMAMARRRFIVFFD